jgi:sodium/bile acid cotransporter 7
MRLSVTVISYITGDAAAQGLLALPAIVGQLTQIFIGSAISAVVSRHQIVSPYCLWSVMICYYSVGYSLLQSLKCDPSDKPKWGY